MNREQCNLLTISSIYEILEKAYTYIPSRYMGTYAFPPIHYYFELTRRCNLRCEMCQYINWLRSTPADEQIKGELTTEEWINVIDQTNRFSLITFTGGEPWVRKDFVKLLEYASAKRRTHFITNGVMLNAEHAELCVRLAPRIIGGAGLNSIGVSIEGPREVHDRIVNKEGAFEKATNGIRSLAHWRKKLSKKYPLIHVTVVIQESNIDALPDMPKIISETGADVINMTIENRSFEFEDVDKMDSKSIEKNTNLIPSIETNRLYESLDKVRREASKHNLELRLPRMPFEKMVDYYASAMCLSDYECRVPWKSLSISAKGEVCMCLMCKLGDIREQSLKEIWNGTEMRQLRKRIKKGLFQFCQGCCQAEYLDKK